MADLLLLHPVTGVTAGVRRLASAWEDAGHTVHVPDFFGAPRGHDVASAMELMTAEDWDRLPREAEDAAADLPGGFVVCGLSLGVLGAMRVGVTNDGVSAVVAVSSAVPEEFLPAPWPRDVPLRFLASRDDAFFLEEGDLAAAQAYVASAADAKLKLLAGSEHLFWEGTDAASEAATSKLYEVVLRRLQLQDELAADRRDPDDVPDWVSDTGVWDLF